MNYLGEKDIIKYKHYIEYLALREDDVENLIKLFHGVPGIF